MGAKSWISIIGIAIVTFIILVATGSLTFKTEPVEEAAADNNAKTIVRYVDSEQLPTTNYDVVVKEEERA